MCYILFNSELVIKFDKFCYSSEMKLNYAIM